MIRNQVEMVMVETRRLRHELTTVRSSMVCLACEFSRLMMEPLGQTLHWPDQYEVEVLVSWLPGSGLGGLCCP